jgi:hypothetical protein
VSLAAGGQVSFLSNRNAGTVLWGDGTYLLFDTNQRTEKTTLGGSI